MSTETSGLYRKYDVRRVNDDEGKHSDCDFFVLDLTHDLIAEKALATYAEEARRIGKTELADDLDRLLYRTRVNNRRDRR